jgi:putative hydrolase of the HAD superfamily
MTMRDDIDLVVFDMDGVLARLDRARRLELLAEMTGKDAEALHTALWASDFEPSAEAGAYPTGAEYLAELNRRAGCSLTRDQWVRARREAMTLDVEVLEIARQVGQHCGIALLTNNGSLLQECLPQILPGVSELFGGSAHASCRFGARKPQPEVFERLLRHHGVAPARTVFIDDDDDYVAGARRVGMHGIRYSDPGALERRLGELGVRFQS